MVEHGRADVVRPRIRRHDHGGNPEPVPVVPVRAAGQVLLAADHAGKDRPQQRLQGRRGADRAAPLDVIGRDRRGWRHVVVVPAVLVVDPDQQGVRPAAAVQDRVDHLGGKALTLADVLRILLGVGVEVRIHDGEIRQRAIRGIREELVGAVHVLHVAADAKREHVGGEFQVLLDALAHGGNGSAEGLQAAPGHLLLVPGVVRPVGLALVVGQRVVVGPGNPVRGQQVEDGPGGRVVEQVVRRVVDQAVRRSRDQKAAVGERGTKA